MFKRKKDYQSDGCCQAGDPSLQSVFGDDKFALWAEAFARFFGTPLFLITQTLIVMVWIVVNTCTGWKFDEYPFILLNLAFSTQAAYAAPLILLAQTRQADRDKARECVDAQHREALAMASAQRQMYSQQLAEKLLGVMEQNIFLTNQVKDLSEQVNQLTKEIHSKIVCTIDTDVT